MGTVMSVEDQVRKYLDEDDWKYDYDANKHIIRLGAATRSKLRSIHYGIRFNEGGYTVYGIAPMNADEDTRSSVMEYITRVNFNLRNGNFELDLSDGEVRYKCYVPTKDLDEIPQIIIEESLIVPILMYNTYGDGLAALIMGFSDPVTEIEKVESK